MTTTTTTDVTYRRPQMPDLEGVAALIAACDTAIIGEDTYGECLTSLRSEWQSDLYNLDDDALVAVTPDGQIIGYEIAYDFDSEVSASCDGYVHPDYLNQGIGTKLLHFAEERVLQAALNLPPERRVSLRATVYSTEEPARQMFLAEGYGVIRNHYQMRITLTEPPPAPELPEGITIRPFVPGQDERIAYETMETAFADHWGHAERSFEEWSSHLFPREDFDPSLWFLAFDGDRPVGAMFGFYRDEMGWVRGLGVRREGRRRGLGMALLLTAFRVFYDRGRTTIGLGVDASSLTGATRLYERAGMRVVHRYDTYEKALRPGH